MNLEKLDPKAAYEHAYNVIKGRWPEAEAAIMTNPRLAYWYAFDVIKGRWPEAEEIIKTDADWFDKYRKNILKT